MPYTFISSTPHFKNAIAKTQSSYAIVSIMVIPDNLNKVCCLSEGKADYKILFRTAGGKRFSKYYSKEALRKVWDELFEYSLKEDLMPEQPIDCEPF